MGKIISCVIIWGGIITATAMVAPDSFDRLIPILGGGAVLYMILALASPSQTKDK